MLHALALRFWLPLQPETYHKGEPLGEGARFFQSKSWRAQGALGGSHFQMIVAIAAADGQMTSEKLALLTFKQICCRFKLPLNLTMDNDVKLFVAVLVAIVRN